MTNWFTFQKVTFNMKPLLQIFFIHLHRLIKMKVYLYHLQITITCSHDFCNTTVVEKSSLDIPVIAHNLFGFDLYYFIKGYIASAWCSKSLNIAGNNLTHINFSNIAGEIKFIDSLNFYRKSLAELASTLSVEEKIAVKELTTNFSNQHYYFSTVCLGLFEFSKERKNIINCL